MRMCCATHLPGAGPLCCCATASLFKHLARIRSQESLGGAARHLVLPDAAAVQVVGAQCGRSPGMWRACLGAPASAGEWRACLGAPLLRRAVARLFRRPSRAAADVTGSRRRLT